MLNYDISGHGKEVLVLLHGFMENNTIWEDMAPFLSGFKLVKIDLPGHGQSSIPESTEILTMATMATEVKQVTDALGLTSFHLLGHSMGGYVSLAFAEQYPEYLKSLSLFFSTYFPDSEEKKIQRQKSFRIILESFQTYVKAGIPLLFNPNDRESLKPKIELAKNIALNTKPESALAAVKGMIERTDKRHTLEQLDIPILIFAGAYDTAVNTEMTINHLPQKKNIQSYLLDCGHNGHWEAPEACAEILNSVLLEH